MAFSGNPESNSYKVELIFGHSDFEFISQRLINDGLKLLLETKPEHESVASEECVGGV